MSNGRLNGFDFRSLALSKSATDKADVAVKGPLHILIPTSLSCAESASLKFGLQLAAALHARATLLRVLEPGYRPHFHHGLNAFDHLFAANVMWPKRSFPAQHDAHTIEKVRAETMNFLAREIAAENCGEIDTHVECRVGDIAYETAHFADHEGVDLVILSSELSIGGLPILPSQIRRILRLTSKAVLVVRPEAKHKSKPSNGDGAARFNGGQRPTKFQNSTLDFGELTVIWQRFKSFFHVFDNRFEDLRSANWKSIVYRDFSAGLIVAMTAIPMAMGFAIAMGLRPEQGIIAGALACIIGRTFGGSKYQVYGPTAAFIPLIAALMAKYGETGGGSFLQGHGFLVLVSVVAGVILMAMGLFGMGRYAKWVPNSIVVGFTIGIAVVIALSNAGEALGLKLGLKGGLIQKVQEIVAQIDHANYYALGLALMTFVLTRVLLKISIFIPAPLIALGVATLLAATVFKGTGVLLIQDRYGSIPTNFFQFTGPLVPELTTGVVIDIVYFAFAIVFVSAVESVLCSTMADRLAGNRKTPFNPDKELWGQGLVQAITPLINGFPCTGALARTATSIKAGAVTPLAGYFKGVLKLAMAFFLASYLNLVPMACIAGILLWVASNMVKPAEIKEVWRHNWFHASLMVYTAVMVPLTDFLTGVLSALIIYAVLRPFCDRPRDLDDSGSETKEPTDLDYALSVVGRREREEAVLE